MGRSQARPSYLSNALAWASVPFLSVVPVGRPLVPVGRPVARRPLARRSAPRRRRPQDARQYTTEERAGGRWDRRRGSVVVGGPVPWSTNRGSRLFATREREARRRESALTDARVTSPQGLNLGAGLVPGGARQSRGRAAAERGTAAEPTTARARRKVYRLGHFVCLRFFDSCSLTQLQHR